MFAEPIWTLVIVPLSLGLLGFVEPCSIGSSLLFIKVLEGKPTRSKIMHATVLTLTRAFFIGLLGILAALAGSVFLGLQRVGWVILGAIYVAIGIAYLSGMARSLMFALGPSLSRWSDLKGSAGLGILFGLNIPACAAPLLAAVLGTASIGEAGNAAKGFTMLAVFGLALSLPVALAVLWAPARRALDWIAGLAPRVPIAIGVVFVLLGAWSIYFGLFVHAQI